MYLLKCAIVLLLLTGCLTKENNTYNRKERVRSNISKRFNMPMGMPMAGPGGPGGGGGTSPMGGPFHHGPMSSPGMGNMMGGGGNPMRGPLTGGGGSMNPGMAGPHSPGHNSMFSGSGFGCVRRKIVCPRWCLVVDSKGCHSCPCGPAAGMALPHNNLMSSIMSTTTGGSGTSTKTSESQCLGQLLCMSSCKNSYTLGSMDSDGCRSCTCETGSGYGYGGGSTGSGLSGGYIISNGGGSGGGFTGGGSVITSNHVTVIQKQKECTALTLCMQTCETGYQLGNVGTDGCRECICPPKKTYVYVQPPKKEYVYVQPQKTVYRPTHVQTYKPVINTFTCTHTLSCSYGCSVGYKCGSDGCPICECIHPQVVGLQVTNVITHQAVHCTNTFTCPRSCKLGYKCGPDGCPTCECLIGVQSQLLTTDCVDCDDIDRFKPQYVQPQRQYVIQTQKEVCHNCETTQTQVVQKPQIVYVQKQYNECTDCQTQPQYVYLKQRPQIVYQKPKPQYVYVKPQPQRIVYVTNNQKETCYGCETHKPEVVYSKPKPQEVVYVTQQRPQPQKVAFTSGGTIGGGGSYTGGSVAYVGSGSGSGSGGVIMGGLNTESCPPMRHDCAPSCIKYVAHCRRCECVQPYPQLTGLLHGK